MDGKMIETIVFGIWCITAFLSMFYALRVFYGVIKGLEVRDNMIKMNVFLVVMIATNVIGQWRWN